LITFIVEPANCDQRGLKVAYTEWFPYTYLENGNESGFEIDIFKAVIAKMGLSARFTQYPWKRCLYVLKSGEADVLISLLKKEDRDKYTYYSAEPISISNTVFFTKSNRNLDFKGSYEELRDLKIGVVDGFSYGSAFDKAAYLNKDVALNPIILIRKLLAGRNDIAAENLTVIEGYAAKMGVIDKIRF
jgi:polar amino acid transport system substrate-binding protein